MGKYYWCLIAALILVSGCTDIPTYTIGVLTPSSGAVARYGAAMQAGYDLYDLDDATYRLVYEDSRCENQATQTAVQKLIAVDHVDMILGPYCDGTNLIAAITAEQFNTVIVSPVGVSKQHETGAYFFRLMPKSEQEIQRLIQYINTTPHRTFAVFYLDNDFGHEYQQVFQEQLEAIQGEVIVSDAYGISQSDFRTTILKIQTLQPDAVYVVSADAHAAQFMRELHEQGISIPIYSSINTQSPRTLEIAGNAAEGVIYPFIDDVHRTKNQEAFYAKLLASGYTDRGFVEATAYDALALVVATLDECGNDVSCQQAYLNSIEQYDGASGMFSLNSGDIEREMIVKKIVDGAFVEVES